MTFTREIAHQLLQGFGQRQRSSGDSSADSLRQYLAQFAHIQRIATDAENRNAHAQMNHMTELLKGFGEADRRWQESEKSTASTFNMLGALGRTGDELLHSSALAWLLSRNIREVGSHAQGSLGFRLFLEETKIEETKLDTKWADEPYFVAKEVQGAKSRIDIEVACPGVFLIHIENKVWSDVGEKQLERESEDLELRRKQFNVPANATVAIFLTPTGRAPTDGFRALGWSVVARVFERFADERCGAKVEIIRLFSSHYAEAVRRYITGYRDNVKESDDGEADV